MVAAAHTTRIAAHSAGVTEASQGMPHMLRAVTAAIAVVGVASIVICCYCCCCRMGRCAISMVRSVDSSSWSSLAAAQRPASSHTSKEEAECEHSLLDNGAAVAAHDRPRHRVGEHTDHSTSVQITFVGTGEPRPEACVDVDLSRLLLKPEAWLAHSLLAEEASQVARHHVDPSDVSITFDAGGRWQPLYLYSEAAPVQGLLRAPLIRIVVHLTTAKPFAKQSASDSEGYYM